MNEDSVKIARDYLDSLMVESRIIGAGRPTSKVEFCGVEFDTPIMTAALSPRVSALFAYFPAFCELTGYYHGRGGGWPHLFRNPDEPNLQARIKVSQYYDTVNFARLLRVPGFYAWGFNDPACCPTSTFSAYNVITAPKQLQVGRDTGHWLYSWQVDNAIQWLKSQFGM